ncbi:MAG: hypothetical protein AB7E52_08800 [Bdellovibrionales bacterium]
MMFTGAFIGKRIDATAAGDKLKARASATDLVTGFSAKDRHEGRAIKGRELYNTETVLFVKA